MSDYVFGAKKMPLRNRLDGRWWRFLTLCSDWQIGYCPEDDAPCQFIINNYGLKKDIFFSLKVSSLEPSFEELAEFYEYLRSSGCPYGAWMFGSFGPAKVRAQSDGTWRLLDGSLAHWYGEKMEDGQHIGEPMHMVFMGVFHEWPDGYVAIENYYTEGNPFSDKSKSRVLTCLTYNHALSQSLYIGNGRDRVSPRLMNAYRVAMKEEYQ